MQIAKQESLLVISRKSPETPHRVQMFAKQADLLRSWAWATRSSPLWGVAEFGTVKPQDNNFRGINHLLFFGPVHPVLIGNLCSAKSQLWLSMGLYNVVVLASSISEATALQKAADNHKRKIPWEYWKIKNGVLIETSVSVVENATSTWREDLIEIAKSGTIPELRDVVREYCTLIASAISRAERCAEHLIPDFLRVNEYVAFLLRRARKGQRSKNGDQYQLYSQLLTINAGLSRFNSQTFSGTSLITDTEGHFRYNSLLGVGTATMGLWRLRTFLDHKLGGGNIPERVIGLKGLPKPAKDLGLIPLRDHFWSTPHLDSVAKDDLRETSIVPLLAYFSARDGFRSTTSTISVPLASVGGCNSLQWSLMTITHEISHTIIHNVLAKLMPDFSSKEETTAAYELFTRKRKPTNLFEEFQRHFYLTVIVVDEFEYSESPDVNEIDITVTHDEFAKTLQSWAHEVEEIMVHVFDFMYFYGHQAKHYVPSIWISWGTIPTIKTRVEEYVVRTVCAVLAANFQSVSEPENWARSTVLRLLKECLSKNKDSSHIQQAIDYLKNEWDVEVKRKVKVRRELVKLTSAFLLSDVVAAEVRGDARFHSKAGEYEGYDLKKLFLTEATIENPLRFVEFYANADQPSLAESLWMFLVLAFCISGTDD